MKLRDLKILFAFFWTIIALSSQAVAQHPSSLSLNEAKLKLEKLRKEYDQINQTFEKDIENQVFTNFGANEKGEFETTKEFDARRAKARVSRLKVAAEKEPLRLSRRIETWVQIDALLDMNFPRSAKATLGLYNADSEKFPIQVEVDGSKFEEFIFVPRPEAQALKEKFFEVLITGIFSLALKSESVVPYFWGVESCLRDKCYSNLPKQFSPSSADLSGYYSLYKSPMVLYLRNSLNKAVESRLGGDEAEVFSKFDKDMLKGKFIVGAVENNLFGGKNFTIVFQDRPHTEFVVWIYNGASGLEVRSFEVSEDELSELRKRRIHYKQFIQDRIHAL